MFAGSPFGPEQKAELISFLPSGDALPGVPAIRAENCIFVGDGDTDVPAFFRISGGNGRSAVVYKKGSERGWRNAWDLYSGVRAVGFIAPADFAVNGHLSMWIQQRLIELAAPRIISGECA